LTLTLFETYTSVYRRMRLDRPMMALNTLTHLRITTLEQSMEG
jgi:hypothetical protein